LVKYSVLASDDKLAHFKNYALLII